MTDIRQEPDADNYTIGYSDPVTDRLSERTAENSAFFFTPHLSPGMRLLDVGCGTGTITADLAAMVAPADVIGVDIEQAQVDRATTYAQKQGVANVEFNVASAHALPFPDASFDAVFSHAMVEHISEPLKAIREMYRVLKPGGVVGLRDSVGTGWVLEPRNPALDRVLDAFWKVWRHNGGNPDAGRSQARLLRQAGFVRRRTSASYEYQDPKLWVDLLAEVVTGREAVDAMVEQGWLTPGEGKKAPGLIREWSRNPDAVSLWPTVEAVAWKD